MKTKRFLLDTRETFTALRGFTPSLQRFTPSLRAKRSNPAFIALLALPVLFTSCSNDNNEPVYPDGAVRFITSIDRLATPGTPGSSSRASGEVWEANDAIGIYMVENGSTTLAGDAGNKQYIVSAASSGSEALHPGSDADNLYYPVSGDKVDFIAYHPWKTTGTDGINADLYPVNVGVQTTPANIDLLWAKADNNTAGYDKTTTDAVALSFYHQLSRFVIKPVAGAGVTSIAGVSVAITGMNTTASFNVKTAAITNEDNPATITPLTVTAASDAPGTEAKYEAIVLPRTVAAKGDVKVTFTLGTAPNEEVFTWEVPAATSFAGGQQYEWTITLSRTGVTATGTINPWGTDGTGGTGETE